jgi:OmcA/MtrC family decaheme c-type cytochrome
MSLISRSLLVLGAAATLVAVPALKPSNDGTPGNGYTPDRKEYYLTAEQMEWIRPGLKVEIRSVTIPDDRKPLVELVYKDDLNQPLDRLGVETPGAVSMSFVMAWWNPTTRYYTAYTTRHVKSPITGVETDQAGTDSGGTWTDVELGRSTYKFKTALPAGFDASKTHTLAMYATRDLRTLGGTRHVVNIEHDFRPDSQPVVDAWNKAETATCNQCHDPLAAHGGARKDVKLCVTCHNPQTIDPDTGNTVDFKVMIHKIHAGEHLPSVEAGTPYQIIGNSQSLHDYSTVAFPQDLRNCTTCHKPASPQGHVWYTNPSSAACGSCHDDVSFATGENHDGGVVTDAQCASCHVPEENEFDASIKGAHVIPTKSATLRGLKVEILGADNAKPGMKPTVKFRITNGDGSAVAASTLDSFALLIGGPTGGVADNVWYDRPNSKAAVAEGDHEVFTLPKALPADATGTWTISADAYRNVKVGVGTDEEQSVREAAVNPVFHTAVTGDTVKPRRQVVDLAKCNTCHDTLALHGGQRFKIEECVICHNPVNSDVSRRPAAEAPEESVSFQRMIHRIHTGEELDQDFTIYGFGSAAINFNEIRFPGDRRNCMKCHVAGSYQLPAPEKTVPVVTKRDYYSPMQSAAAACLGCHDTLDATAHAYVNTAPFGESCAACHGVGREFAVDSVHAR